MPPQECKAAHQAHHPVRQAVPHQEWKAARKVHHRVSQAVHHQVPLYASGGARNHCCHRSMLYEARPSQRNGPNDSAPRRRPSSHTLPPRRTHPRSDLPTPPAPAATGGDAPNIIFFMADDMGFSDIGCYGGEINTPNLDTLADNGVRFTQFYNNAKCTTTRASILTGLYPRRGKGGLLRQNMVTLGEAMKRVGYRTALSGKWHLGSGETTHPYRRGFDEYYGLLGGCCHFCNPKQRDPQYKGGRIRNFGRNDKGLTEFPDGYYTTDAFTDHAIECIGKFSKKENPFFLHICYTAPHYPLHAKPEDIKQ